MVMVFDNVQWKLESKELDPGYAVVHGEIELRKLVELVFLNF